MPTDRDARVLVVDDDPQVLELFVTFLEGSYDVVAAASGREALEHDLTEIDVVLLDRRMPGMNGGEVLEVIRERGVDCRVAMITAVDPDLDIVDMGFDDYLVKPVNASKLKNVVDSLLRWDEYDAILRKYFKVARKVSLLEENNTLEALDATDEYVKLKDRLAELEAEADDALGSLEDDLSAVVNATTELDADRDATDTVRYSS